MVHIINVRVHIINVSLGILDDFHDGIDYLNLTGWSQNDIANSFNKNSTSIWKEEYLSI